MREYLEEEYFDVQNIGLILIDIVPYENKAQMIDGFKKMFCAGNLTSMKMRFDGPRLDCIPDIKKSGLLAAGGSANIGFVFNSDLDVNYLTGIKRRLPRMLKMMEIEVAQSVDFAYTVTYVCHFKKEFYNRDIKDVFIKSDELVPFEEMLEDGSILKGERSRGPEFEPSMIDFQLNIESFLRDFSSGLYLNKNSEKNKVPCCPSIEILSTDDVPFEGFEEWWKSHHKFLNFINFDLYHYSKFEYLLVGFQEREIYGKYGISSGLIMIASKKHFEYESGYSSVESGIIANITYMAIDLHNLFLLTYWANYQVEITQKEWEKKFDSYLSDTSILSKSSDVQNMKNLTQIYVSMVKESGSFESYFLSESRNYVLFRRLFPWIRKKIKHFEPLLPNIYNRNVIEAFFESGKNLLEEEKNRNETFRRELDSLLNYTRNLTDLAIAEVNIDLQNIIRKYTKAIFILTILMIIVSAIQVTGLTTKELIDMLARLATWAVDHRALLAML